MPSCQSSDIFYRNGWLGVKHQVTYSDILYRNGWLGVKHQVTYSDILYRNGWLGVKHKLLTPVFCTVMVDWA